VKIDEIDPVLYSEEEIAWLLENLGKPPAVAFRDALPKGVNVRQVRPLMEKLQELEQLKEHEGQNWIGFEEVKDALRAYQREDAKWLNDTKRRRNSRVFTAMTPKVVPIWVVLGATAAVFGLILRLMAPG
jgi:hypothetical protein